MRITLAAATLALVAGTTAACGADGPPADASTEDFCKVFDDFYAELQDLGAESETADQVQALKDTGEELAEVGTPDDIPDEAREGFELAIQTIEDLPDDATEEEISKLEEDFSDAEQEQSDAFDDYLSETCETPAG